MYRREIIGGAKTPTLFGSPELGHDEWPTLPRLISAQVRAEGHVWPRYEVRETQTTEVWGGRGVVQRSGR